MGALRELSNKIKTAYDTRKRTRYLHSLSSEELDRGYLHNTVSVAELIAEQDRRLSNDPGLKAFHKALYSPWGIKRMHELAARRDQPEQSTSDDV